MPKVIILPTQQTIEVSESLNLLEACRAQDVYVKSSCGGHATCTDCKIKIVSGEDHLTPMTFGELKLLGNIFHLTRERLACQTCVTGDVTIDLSDHDKERDQNRMQKKNKQFAKRPMVRKKETVAELKKEKEAAFLESQKDQKTDQWHKHWDKKEEDPNAIPVPKRLGGGRRPKRKP